MSPYLFWPLAGVTLLSALGVVTLRNTMHSALLLGLSLAGVAGLYLSLGADFLFAAQLLVYVGGIALLILFVVMLSGRADEMRLRQTHSTWLAAVMVCGVVFFGLWRIVALARGVLAETRTAPTTAPLGVWLLGEMAVPFELITLVLVAALVGAVVFGLSPNGSVPEK
ncbi:MAG: NADH-quinone oxidoreductase subunit J [Elusimicrobiota bacterium]